MTLDEFTTAYPQFAFDFAKPLKTQPRILEPFTLDQLPIELQPTNPYRSGSRGRPNLNQTLTHFQCAVCKRVLRNDLFYTPPSFLRRNMVFTQCRDCTHKVNAQRYDLNARLIQARRIAVWQYLAPACSICGFNTHVSALDMHHLSTKESVIAELITAVTFTPSIQNAEKLLREASNCIPLCSNCHRMVHAGVLSIPARVPAPDYSLVTLLRDLNDIDQHDA